MTTKQWIVVGVSGATCSGKSTLASKICDNFPGSIVIRQDDYFLPSDDPHHVRISELDHLNWELITSMDMNKMYSDVMKILQSHVESEINSRKKLLILDGFMLFQHKAITDLCDHKYFLTLMKEQCWERRKDRTYEPPDVPGYFDKVVWPEYIQYKSKVTQDKDLQKTTTFIDGSKNMAEIYEIVSKQIIQSFLP